MGREVPHGEEVIEVFEEGQEDHPDSCEVDPWDQAVEVSLEAHE